MLQEIFLKHSESVKTKHTLFVDNIMRILKNFTFFLFIFSSVTAFAENNLVQKELMYQAEQFVSQQLITDDNAGRVQKVESTALDPRIRIPVCHHPYSFSTNSNVQTQSAITVKASCPGNDWFLFFVVKVKQQQPVVVARTALSPGTILTSSNTHQVLMDSNRLRSSVFTNPEDVLGARAKRRMRPGQAFQPQLLCFVCKGDRIVITANSGGLKIKTSGVAQQDGNVGDTILVRNTSSKKVISAVVADINKVNVSI